MKYKVKNDLFGVAKMVHLNEFLFIKKTRNGNLWDGAEIEVNTYEDSCTLTDKQAEKLSKDLLIAIKARRAPDENPNVKVIEI